MKKKLLFLGLIILLLCGCSFRDGSKFKKEYESINGKKVSETSSQRVVIIDKDNPFIYSTAEEIIAMMDSKETFFVYFGDKQCPWCRSSIEKAIESTKKNGIEKIYYINIWDDNHNEILRDKYIINDNNELELVVSGTDDYKELLKRFDSLLEEYILTDSNGKKVATGEKRIFAPNYIYVKDGKAIKLISGTSSLQENAYSELTEEILKDEETIFDNFFKTNNYCDDAC